MPRWGPAKPKTRIKVIECGAGHWDEQDHALDIPHGIDTIDFKVTGTGHERIEQAFADGCANCGKLTAFDENLSSGSPPGYVSTPVRSSCSTRRLELQ